MLQSTNDLHGFTIHAKDGDIGTIEDLYFDDGHWKVRYLVVDTGTWLTARRVLISPASAKGVDWFGQRLPADLTCDQVRNSPDIATDKPVSRQHEEELSAYYGWPSYWTGDAFAFDPMTVPVPLPPIEASVRKGDPNLRSAREVKGYHIEALDGPIGHVSDFIFDDETWEIRFMIVDAGSWLHERLVLLKPDWVEGISWDERHVAVKLTRETVRTSPIFVPVFPISSGYIQQLMEHYRQTG
jgi:uncharacterized protein YrrD